MGLYSSQTSMAKFELLAENNMGERENASPVPVANRPLIRGEQHFFCIADEN
jgi:hypothetical protein